jgi:hypothetical protein
VGDQSVTQESFQNGQAEEEKREEEENPKQEDFSSQQSKIRLTISFHQFEKNLYTIFFGFHGQEVNII